MAKRNGLSIRNKQREPAEVGEAERKLGGVLHELEERTGVDVQDVELQEVVDTDASGAPVVRKAVDIQVARRPLKKGWSR